MSVLIFTSTFVPSVHVDKVGIGFVGLLEARSALIGLRVGWSVLVGLNVGGAELGLKVGCPSVPVGLDVVRAEGVRLIVGW